MLFQVRLQEALKQQQQLMMPPGPGTAAQALSDGSVRYPMVPYPGQPIQQQQGGGGMMGVASGRTMMAANGDHHLLQTPHQSTRPSLQRMPLKYDRHQPPGMTPCSQPYPGFNQECVRQLPLHQVVPHINPQLMNHSSVQQPQGSTMGLASYLLPPADKMLGPGALQMAPDCSSGGALASSSPCPANNSLSPHHLPSHYKNQMLPHSTVQRMGHVGPQQKVLCQDAMFARQLSFSPNAKTPEMASSTISRQTELTDSLQQQQQQQPFSGANSYLHFLDRKWLWCQMASWSSTAELCIQSGFSAVPIWEQHLRVSGVVGCIRIA